MADGTNAADVKVEDLGSFVAKVDSVDEVKRLQAGDSRVTAQPVYEARIAELEKPTTPPSPTTRASGGGKREAATRVKYKGTWYAPGEPVPFESAKDAEPYDATGALAPAKK